MGRPLNPDLTKHWKISLPATLAGTVEFYLFDPVHGKPLYGSRARLIHRDPEATQAAAPRRLGGHPRTRSRRTPTHTDE